MFSLEGLRPEIVVGFLRWYRAYQRTLPPHLRRVRPLQAKQAPVGPLADHLEPLSRRAPAPRRTFRSVRPRAYGNTFTASWTPFANIAPPSAPAPDTAM